MPVLTPGLEPSRDPAEEPTVSEADLPLLVWAARRRLGRRVTAYATAYAPILAKLSETEFIGLMEAVSGESERRTAEEGRDGRVEALFAENAARWKR